MSTKWFCFLMGAILALIWIVFIYGTPEYVNMFLDKATKWGNI